MKSRGPPPRALPGDAPWLNRASPSWFRWDAIRQRRRPLEPQRRRRAGLARRLGGASVAVLHAGDPDEPALRGYLALGAPCVQTIDVPRDRDVLDPLAALLSDYALVLCGSRGESGMGSGLLPYLLAQRLGRPLLPNVLSAQLAGGAVRARQFLPGRRRDMEADLPALLTVHPPRPSNHAMPMRGSAPGAYCPLRRPPRPRRWPTPGASNRPTRGAQAGRARTPLRPRPAAGRDRHGQPGRRSHSARLPGRQSARGACLSAHSQPG